MVDFSRVWTAALVLALTASASAQTPQLTALKRRSAIAVTFDLASTDTRDLAPRLRSRQPVSVTWHIDVRRLSTPELASTVVTP